MGRAPIQIPQDVYEQLPHKKSVTVGDLAKAVEAARIEGEQIAALTAERDTLKALCVELVDSLSHMEWCQPCAEDWETCSDGVDAKELLTRARSILK